MITIECEDASEIKTVSALKHRGLTTTGVVYAPKTWVGKKVRIIVVKEVK